MFSKEEKNGELIKTYPEDNLNEQIDNEDKYCGCGLFDFDYYIPEGYGVYFQFDENNGDGILNLKLIKKLIKNEEEINEVLTISDIKFCERMLFLETINIVDINEPGTAIEAIYNPSHDSRYVFCRGDGDDNLCDETNQITFVRGKDNEVCIVSHRLDYIGVVGLNADESNQDPNSISVYDDPKNEENIQRLIIPGCS